MLLKKWLCVPVTGSSADDESDEGSSSSRHKKPDLMETNVLSSAESGVVHDLDHETEDAMLEFTSGMCCCVCQLSEIF